MAPASSLWIFFGLVFGIVLLPGLDMACVSGELARRRPACRSRLGGRHRHGGRRPRRDRRAGDRGDPRCGAFIVQRTAAPRRGLHRLDRSRARPQRHDSCGRLREQRGSGRSGGIPLVIAFRRGMLTNLLNPKAYVFMLAVFPQFVRPEWGPIWMQAVVLGAIIIVTQLAVYSPIASPRRGRGTGWPPGRGCWQRSAGPSASCSSPSPSIRRSKAGAGQAPTWTWEVATDLPGGIEKAHSVR